MMTIDQIKVGGIYLSTFEDENLVFKVVRIVGYNTGDIEGLILRKGKNNRPLLGATTIFFINFMSEIAEPNDILKKMIGE